MIQELIIIALISLGIAYFRKKDVSTLENIKIKGLGFFILSLLIQSGGVYLALNYNDWVVGNFLKEHFIWLHCISYQLILIGIALNLEKNYMKIFFVGTLLNFTVILLNGMKMPVRLPLDMANAWENFVYLNSSKDLIHTLMDTSTRLNFLGDIFVLRDPYPFTKAVSIGDILLLLGFFIMVQEETSPKENINDQQKTG
jgi:hypothetical protein